MARIDRRAITRFCAEVWKYYRAHGRHDLPWRKTKDPYKIMVSEVMLQQTQVPRVLEKYKEFLAAFPTVESLARSRLADVLKVWSGMGYNRRGKYLRDAAIEIVTKYKGKIPKNSVALRALAGIGPYTASAILIFAFNIPDTMIETNVRTAFIHHFFADTFKVSDRQLLTYIEKAAEGQDPRTWHWALMDYGSYLKKIHTNPSRASAHYTKQSKFEGSLRQIRGAILRELDREALSEDSLYERLNLYRKGSRKVKPHEASYAQKLPRTDLGNGKMDLEKLGEALGGLSRDGMIKKQKEKWRIA